RPASAPRVATHDRHREPRRELRCRLARGLGTGRRSRVGPDPKLRSRTAAIPGAGVGHRMAEVLLRGEHMNSRTSVPKIAAAACLGALVVAGCGSSSGKPSASAPPPTSAPTTTTRAPTQAVVSATDVRVIPGSATGKSPCEKASPTPASPGQVAGGSGGTDALKNAAEV